MKSNKFFFGAFVTFVAFCLFFFFFFGFGFSRAYSYKKNQNYNQKAAYQIDDKKALGATKNIDGYYANYLDYDNQYDYSHKLDGYVAKGKGQSYDEGHIAAYTYDAPYQSAAQDYPKSEYAGYYNTYKDGDEYGNYPLAYKGGYQDGAKQIV